MDGAIAAAGENGVATGIDRTAGLFDGMFRRLRGNQISFNAGLPEHGERGFQVTLPLLAGAGRRIVDQSRLAHRAFEAGLQKLDCN